MCVVPHTASPSSATGNQESRVNHRDRPTQAVDSHVVNAIAMLRGVGPIRSRPLTESQADALAVIYRAYSGMLLSVLRQLLGTRSDAEDVLHDVFTRLPSAIAHYRENSFGGWLRQMAVRLGLTRMRTQRRRHEYALPDAQSLACDEVDAVDFDALQRRDALREAVAALSEPLRQVVVLRVFFELSHQEVADALGISPTASEVRMCRALKQLRSRMRHSPERVSREI